MMLSVADYAEVSRQWSVLKYIAEEILAGEGLTFSPQNLLGTSYFAAWPVGSVNRPAVIFEYASDGPAAGTPGRQAEYELTLLLGVFSATAEWINASEKLGIYKEKLYRGLSARRIPFFDFRSYATQDPVRAAGMDFELRYQGCSLRPEKEDRTRNMLMMRFSAKI